MKIRTLRKGHARTELTRLLMVLTAGDCSIEQAAAAIGGAVISSCKSMGVDEETMLTCINQGLSEILMTINLAGIE